MAPPGEMFGQAQREKRAMSFDAKHSIDYFECLHGLEEASCQNELSFRRVIAADCLQAVQLFFGVLADELMFGLSCF